RATHLAALDAQPETRHAHPRWLAEAIARDWPTQAEAVLAADNREPPLMLRANRRHGTREALVEHLRLDGQTAEPHAWLADAIMLPHSTDVTRLPGFDAGPSRCRTAPRRSPPTSPTCATACACSTPAPRRAARPATCWNARRSTSPRWTPRRRAWTASARTCSGCAWTRAC